MKKFYTVLLTSSVYSHQRLQEILLGLKNDKFFHMTDKVNAWYMYYIDKVTISMKFNLKPCGDEYVINFYIEGKDDKPIINTTDFKTEYIQDYNIIEIVEKVVEKIEEEDLHEMIKSLNRTILDALDMTNDTTIPQNATELEDYMKYFKYEDYAKDYFDTDISFSNYVINNKPSCIFIPPRCSGKTMALLKTLKLSRNYLYKLTKSQGENMIQKIQVNEKKKIVTVVFEDSCDVQMVKCSDKDEFDPLIGVALCIAAHVFHSKTKFKKFVNAQIEKQNKKKKCMNSSKSEKTK